MANNTQIPDGYFYDEEYAKDHPGYLYTDPYGNTFFTNEYEELNPGNEHGSSHYNNIQTKAVNSTVYQNAYKLFSSAPFQSEMWLQRLEALVLALQDIPRNPWDVNDGFHNEVNEKSQLEQFFLNVNTLVSEYQQWFNSLPPEQRSQYSSAGINVALDGGSSITGSTAPTSNAAPAGVGNLSNSSEDNALNYISSISGGLLSFISAFNGVFGTAVSLSNAKRSNATQRDISQDTLNLQRQQLGLNPISLGSSTIPSITSQDILTGPLNAAQMKNSLDYMRFANEFQPEALLQSAYNSGQAEVFQEMYGELGNLKLQSVYLDALLQLEIKSSSIKNVQLEQKKTSATSEAFDSLGQDLVNSQMESQTSGFKESKSLSELRSRVQQYKKNVISDWIEKANDPHNPYGWMYQTMLMKLTGSVSEYGNPADVMFDYGTESTDIITKWLQTITEFNTKSKQGKVPTKKSK